MRISKSSVHIGVGFDNSVKILFGGDFQIREGVLVWMWFSSEMQIFAATFPQGFSYKTCLKHCEVKKES